MRSSQYPRPAGVSTVSIENLEEKMKALECVVSAHRELVEALKRLPPKWASEVLDDLGVTVGLSDTDHDTSEEYSLREKSGAKPSVIALLREDSDRSRDDAIL